MEHSTVSRKRRRVSESAVTVGSEELLSENQGISLSCTICKQRKVRCDRVRPACGWCTKSGVSCVYAEKRKPGMKAGFGRDLIERLERLETVVLTNVQSIQSLQSQWETVQMSSPLTTSAQTSNIRNIPDSAATTSVDGRPSDTSPSTVVQSDCSSPAVASVRSQNDLPSDDILRMVVQLYFDNVNSWIPVLYPEKTWSRLFPSNSRAPDAPILMYAILAAAVRFLPDELVSKERKKDCHTCAKQKITLLTLELPTVESLEAMIVLAIDTVGEFNGPKCWAILSMISSVTLKLGLNREKLDSVTLTPLNSESGESISTKGVPIIPESIDAATEERRRRLFWAAYILDRYSSVSSSFNFNIPTSEVMRRLPSLPHSSSADSLCQLSSQSWLSCISRTQVPIPSPGTTEEFTAAEPFAYEIELLSIISAIHEFLRRPINIQSSQDVERWHLEFRKFCVVIDEWKLSLPKEYSSVENIIAKFNENSDTDPLWILVYSLYNTAVVRINSAVGYPYQQSSKFRTSYPARECCLTAVANVVELTKFITSDPGKFYKCLGPHYAWMLWVTARLSIVHSFTTKAMLTDDITVLVRTLSAMGQYWSVARRYSDLLLMVIEEGWLSKIREHDSNGNDDRDERERMASAKILSDMRWTASDLDFLLSMSKNKSDSVSASSGRLFQRPNAVSDESDTTGATLTDSTDSVSMNLSHTMDRTSLESIGQQQISQSQRLDTANIFEWFNWPKAADTNGNMISYGNSVNSVVLGGSLNWNFLPGGSSVYVDSNGD
ncbi:fungal-specific transcription factor domain-containing protein [Lipomyces tetrasporus]|uniref:Fungal-specific transcription factor domain-containing protein n=1 Tax=Lipomyces tetrasporus TaxID=54092 RepID=A0AAD7QNQ6_9ASCO|nr:fungal-specific transcription factor domain-containing protein [Lipomyces tetrasporus]KAJ8098519.1 fungal-specific transcription factor domain-containing protein [Lipomyces tetrasporus]